MKSSISFTNSKIFYGSNSTFVTAPIIAKPESKPESKPEPNPEPEDILQLPIVTDTVAPIMKILRKRGRKPLNKPKDEPVSYTHLTLPTIYSV